MDFTSSRLFNSLLYFLVGIAWGCTNPFIKRAEEKLNSSSHGRDKQVVQSQTLASRLMVSVMNPAMWIPYGMNQCGSLIFWFLSAREPVQRAAPVCNTLAFIFTAATAHLVLGEEVRRPLIFYAGVLLVGTGVFVILALE